MYTLFRGDGMDDEDMPSETTLDLSDYKSLETRLYGELIKSCRKYSNNLNLISILGILDLVKQEMKELEATHLRFMKKKATDMNDESLERVA